MTLSRPFQLRPRALLLLLAGVGLLSAAPSTAEAQWGWGRYAPRIGQWPEGGRSGFTFCRLVYASNGWREAGGQGWRTDYPMADENLMLRIGQFTTTRVTRTQDGTPAPVLVRASDPVLFRCPFLFASDVGTLGFTDEEVVRLREYLLKGGFLWVDDFWGPRAWQQWTLQIGRVLPEFEVVELTPEHPLFSTFYTLNRVPQIPSIQFWRTSGGLTSERGLRSQDARLYGIFDDTGQLLVLMSHNTDIADGWEREGEDYDFFQKFSPYGYAVGVNVVIWATTH